MVAHATNGSTKPKLTVDDLSSPLNFVPQSDWILGMFMEPGETSGGIAIPETANVGPPRVLIVSVGPGRVCEYNPENGRLPMDAEPGDVVYSKGGEFEKFYLGKKVFCIFQNWQIVAKAPLEKVSPEELADIVSPPKPRLMKV